MSFTESEAVKRVFSPSSCYLEFLFFYLFLIFSHYSLFWCTTFDRECVVPNVFPFIFIIPEKSILLRIRCTISSSVCWFLQRITSFYRLFQLPRIPQEYFLSATIPSCIDNFQLNFSLYSICYLLVGFLLCYRYIVFHLLSKVAIFLYHLLFVFSILHQSYFSIIFIVFHSRMFPTTDFVGPTEGLSLQSIFFRHKISFLFSIISNA